MKLDGFKFLFASLVFVHSLMYKLHHSLLANILEPSLGSCPNKYFFSLSGDTTRQIQISQFIKSLSLHLHLPNVHEKSCVCCYLS